MSPFSQHPQAIVEAGSQIGEGTRIWAFTNVKSGAIIGRYCNICDGCYIEKGARLGDHVTLKNGVNVFDGVSLADDVFVGAHTAFINDRHPRSHRSDDWVLEPTWVQKGATIGSNATILCGITIGEYAFIGAGSVVTRDVAPYSLVAGNPAVFKGYVCRCGHRLPKDLLCQCRKAYALTPQGLLLKSE